MPLQPARIYAFRNLPLRDQAGEQLRFVLGTNTFWHKGRRYAYGQRERPSWHTCLFTNAGVEVDCFWLAGTIRIRGELGDKVLFNSRYMIYCCESSAEEDDEEPSTPQMWNGEQETDEAPSTPEL